MTKASAFGHRDKDQSPPTWAQGIQAPGWTLKAAPCVQGDELIKKKCLVKTLKDNRKATAEGAPKILCTACTQRSPTALRLSMESPRSSSKANAVERKH